MANNRPWHFHQERHRPDGWFSIYRGAECPGRGSNHPKRVGAARKDGPRRWGVELFGHLANVETVKGKGRTRNEAVCDALCKKGIPYADEG